MRVESEWAELNSNTEDFPKVRGHLGNNRRVKLHSFNSGSAIILAWKIGVSRCNYSTHVTGGGGMATGWCFIFLWVGGESPRR